MSGCFTFRKSKSCICLNILGWEGWNSVDATSSLSSELVKQEDPHEPVQLECKRTELIFLKIAEICLRGEVILSISHPVSENKPIKIVNLFKHSNQFKIMIR